MQDGVQQSPQETAEGQQTPKATEADGLSYWRGIAQQYREKAAAFDQYEPIITHLNENPAHVEDFRRIVRGEAQLIAAADGMATGRGNRSRQKTEEELLAEELGLDDDDQPQPEKPKKPRGEHKVSEEEARRFGALQERARIEFEQFEDSMKHEGVGEHMLDEFQQWLQNPGGINYYDLFSAWSVNKRRSQGEDSKEIVRGLIPVPPKKSEGSEPAPRPGFPITTIPGGKSNRPDARLFVDSSGVVARDKWVPNPAEI